MTQDKDQSAVAAVAVEQPPKEEQQATKGDNQSPKPHQKFWAKLLKKGPAQSPAAKAAKSAKAAAKAAEDAAKSAAIASKAAEEAAKAAAAAAQAEEEAKKREEEQLRQQEEQLKQEERTEQPAPQPTEG